MALLWEFGKMARFMVISQLSSNLPILSVFCQTKLLLISFLYEVEESGMISYSSSCSTNTMPKPLGVSRCSQGQAKTPWSRISSVMVITQSNQVMVHISETRIRSKEHTMNNMGSRNTSRMEWCYINTRILSGRLQAIAFQRGPTSRAGM